MDEDMKFGITLLILGLLFGFFIGYISQIDNGYKEINELGSAICEEEYGMDFKSYYKGELKCENKVISKRYDGVKVIHELGSLIEEKE